MCAPLAILVFDIDGVLRDVSNSYRRALADTVEQFTEQQYWPSPEDIDTLKGEGLWNNDWEGAQELVYRHFEATGCPQESGDSRLRRSGQLLSKSLSGSRPKPPNRWRGYITQEPLLVSPAYFSHLRAGQIPWGFFSGATRGSARYVLERRLGLVDPVLIAMEDAPGKPDPTGLLEVVQILSRHHHLSPQLPVVYAGDTVADMHTLHHARQRYADRPWIGVGVLPPHVVAKPESYRQSYRATLEQAGAQVVIEAISDLTSTALAALIGAENS